MKIAVSFFAILLFVPIMISDSNAAEVLNQHNMLIKQGCQMGRDDAKSGKTMDSGGISLKNAGSKYIELEALIRKEYEKCYRRNNSTISSTPIPSIDNNNSGSKAAAFTPEEITRRKVNNKEYSKNNHDVSGLKLPPHTSEKPFAWFHDWISVVEEVPGRYATEKKRAEDLRVRFNKSCQNAYLVSKNDEALIARWCNITGWKEFNLDSFALWDDQFKRQLEQMKGQIGYSEEAFSTYGERDVKNAFDRTKGAPFDYQMSNIERQMILPYLSGVSIALANIKATNNAMRELDEQLVAKRKKGYLAELEMIKKRRIEEEKNRVQRENQELYLKQKTQADMLIEDVCKSGKEDAVNLKKLQPNQYASKAKMLDKIDGLEEYIATRYTECYDTELISLTCKKAGEDFMNCRNEEPPSKYVSLASNNKTIHDFQAEYKKCHEERKELYAKAKIEREKLPKNIIKYTEIYRERGGYFINDYNECVASSITATKKLSRKMRLAVLSNSDVRSCEDESRLLKKYAAQSCSCKYGVVVDTLNENEISEFSEDILALIKFSHSNIGNNKSSKVDGKGFKNSLRHPVESTELFKKIGSACAK
ncbi:MAG: hypothetical protein U9N50_13275 [Pseudomonadota bacterium]|nr:hypothetical protein [Pseudomonadota bacterium]